MPARSSPAAPPASIGILSPPACIAARWAMVISATSRPFAGPDGTAHIAATAPRITDLNQLRGKALMIHAMGDNYADEPKPDGGGGARVACGIIQ